MASPSTPAKSQYHHFIPRFILRNFAHPFKPPETPPKGYVKRGRRSRKGGYHTGEPMLHTINLTGANVELIETSVSRTFGQVDMYRDLKDATNQHYLEEQLSRLESRAGQIIQKIRTTFEAGKQEVWITRPDRNILRKFLFIMKYRGTTMHKRFYHQNAEGYSADDKEKLLKYMREKGYQKPVDVWFDNIKAILELKMDPEGKWMEELKKRVYPDDAMMYIAHTQMMYLALCTPSVKDDEFLLTQNAYSIHEGPNSLLTDPDTSESVVKCYTEFHVFSVISPKLIIVLRSFLLPVLLEDSNEEIRRWRETMLQLNVIQHNDPSRAKSVLEDLPITKARNSYTRVVDGRIVLLDGENGSPRSDHKYCFRFFPISTEHVNKMNCIMLEQSYHTSTIVFKSRLGTRKTLEYYLSMPCERDKMCGFKIVGDEPNDPRLVCLKKLEQTVKQLGSDTTAVYRIQPSKVSDDDNFEVLGQLLAEGLPKEPSEFMKLYMKLGGSATTMPKDIDQAKKMLNMRIKIDVWSQGLDENIREEIREHLRDLFCQLPARRVWLYLKNIRYMHMEEKESNVTVGSQRDSENEPEDIIVNSSHLIPTNRLCCLMYFATLNHLHIAKIPDFDLAGEITFDEKGARRLGQIKAFAFGASGSICDCAISAIEEKAKLCRDMARMTRLHERYKNPFWTVGENIEMATRVLVRVDFSDLLGGSLSLLGSEALERVLFGLVYPSPGCTWN